MGERKKSRTSAPRKKTRPAVPLQQDEAAKNGARQCTASTKAGTRCTVQAIEGGDKCLFHSGRAAEMGRRGGRRNRRFVPEASDGPLQVPTSADGVKTVLAQTLAEIRAGRCDPKQGSVIGYLGVSLLRAIEVADFELRLAKLEAARDAEEQVAKAGKTV